MTLIQATPMKPVLRMPPTNTTKRRCCYVFTLRQGAMLIAVVDLLLTVVGLFLLLLGTSHAHDVSRVLAADREDVQQRHVISVLEGYSGHSYNNEERLQVAQHLALVMILAMYTGLAYVTLHLITCMLLLYGAIIQKRLYMLPWISLGLGSIVVVFSSLIMCMVMGYGSLLMIISVSILIKLRFVLWFVILKYYRELLVHQPPCCAMMFPQKDKTEVKEIPYKPSDV